MENVFLQQKARSQQLLTSLHWKPLAPSYPLSALQVELANLDSIYMSYKPLILTVTQQLKREPSFNGISTLNKHTKRSLLPSSGDELSWLTSTVTTKDIREIMRRVNQLIETQTQQQDTLVHVISILNITRYPMKVNRQHINAVIEAVQRTHQDITTLFNITSSIYTCINYQQILLHVCSILVNLRDSLYYIRQIVMHAMDYRCSHHWDVVTTHTSSRGFERNADAHQNGITINYASPSIIGWHPLPLLISAHPHFSGRGTVFTTDWCTYSGSSTATQDLPGLQPIHT